MKLPNLPLALAVLSFAGSFSMPASAQSARTWVSGTGDDANPCTRTAPCQTFAGAVSRTAAGGEINCLDAGGYGALTITKALSIICSAGEAGILTASTDGIIINAGANDRIVLDGLDVQGLGTGLNGINIQSAGEVVIRNSSIYQFGGNGVTIATNTLIRVIVRNSTIGENAGSGVVVNSAAGFGHVRIFNSMIHTNVQDGVQVNGQGNEAVISQDEILGNARQLNVSSGVSGGLIYSLGNNTLVGRSDSATSFSIK